MPPRRIRSCAVCGKSSTKLLRCARCKIVFYCSQADQKRDWKYHKLVCKPPSKIDLPEEKQAWIDLSCFDNVSPQILQVSEVVGCRDTTPTQEFYRKVKHEKLHNGGCLPPPSNTFKRDHPTVYVLYNEHNKPLTSVPGWNYYCIGDLQGPTFVEPRGSIIILLRPGNYDLCNSSFHLFFEQAGDFPVEIIGEGETPNEVTIELNKPTFVEGHGYFHTESIRLCNLVAVDCAYQEKFLSANFIEVESVVFEDNSIQDYSGDLILPKKWVIMRDCIVTNDASVVSGDPANVYIIHCTFISCSIPEDWEVNDPFLNASIIRIPHYSNVMISNCKVDESNMGHVLHRSVPIFESIGKAKIMKLFSLLGIPAMMNQQGALESMQQTAHRPTGKTILHKNAFELEICKQCDIVKNSHKIQGTQCLPNQRETEDARILYLNNLAIQNILEHHSSFVHSIHAGASSKMKLSIQRWALRGPYNLQCNWKAYWKLRDTLEFNDILDEGDDYYEDSETPDVDRLEKVKKQVSKVFTNNYVNLTWNPENHSKFPKSFRNIVVTVLLCIQRLKNTDGGVWQCIPYDILYLIFNELATSTSISEEAFLNSIYLEKSRIVWEDYDCVRTVDLRGSIFCCIASGYLLSFHTSYHCRARSTFVEQFSGICFSVRNIDDTNEKAEFHLFGKDDEKVSDVLEYRIIDEDHLKILMKIICGSDDAVDSYTLFCILFYAAGGGLYSQFDDWPLDYAEKKFKDRLSDEEFAELCPPTRDFRDPSDEDMSDEDDMYY